MKKKGFTLIELLAVIVILAIIMVIAVPKIIDVIESSRKSAFMESAGLMAKSAQLKYANNNVLGSFKGESIYTFENGEYTSSSTLDFKGDKPFLGKIYVNDKGKVSLAIVSNDKKYCAIKDLNNKKINVYYYENDKCNNKTLDELYSEINISNEKFNVLNIKPTTANFTFRQLNATDAVNDTEDGLYFATSYALNNSIVYYNDKVSISEKGGNLSGTVSLYTNYIDGQPLGEIYIGVSKTNDISTTDFTSFQKLGVIDTSWTDYTYDIPIEEPGEYYIKVTLYHNNNTGSFTVYAKLKDMILKY